MDASLACKVVRDAMVSPAAVHELWEATVASGAPSSSSLALASRLGGTSATAIELANNRDAYLEFLRDPSRYPADLLDEASRRFPLAVLRFEYDVPKGFIRRRGLFAWLERFTMGVRVKLTASNSRIPAIVMFRPKPATCVFPWQQADDFCRNHRRESQTARYVTVANTIAYEVAYQAHGDTWLEKDYYGTIVETQLTRVMVPIVTTDHKEHLVMFAEQFFGLDKPAFDAFVSSLR